MKTLSVTTEAELRAALQSGSPVSVQTRGIDINTEGCNIDDLVFCGAVTATLAAGEPWGEFVAMAVENGWGGVEALAAVPGTVGDVVAANPVRFGQSPADTVASVRTWDRVAEAQRTFAMVDCEFGPGSSRFSREHLADGTPRYVIVEAALLLKQADITTRIHDSDLIAALGVHEGERVSLARVRDVALGLPLPEDAASRDPE